MWRGVDGPTALRSPVPTEGDGGPRGRGFQLASAGLLLLLRKEAPCLQQSRALGWPGGEVVPLPLGVPLDWSHDVSVAPVLGTTRSRSSSSSR